MVPPNSKHIPLGFGSREHVYGTFLFNIMTIISVFGTIQIHRIALHWSNIRVCMYHLRFFVCLFVSLSVLSSNIGHGNWPTRRNRHFGNVNKDVWELKHLSYYKSLLFFSPLFAPLPANSMFYFCHHQYTNLFCIWI